MDTRTIIAVVAGLIAFMSLLMALGRTPPDDAKTNLIRWSEFFRIHRIPEWFKSQAYDLWFSRLAVLSAVISAVISALALNQRTPTVDTGIAERLDSLMRDTSVLRVATSYLQSETSELRQAIGVLRPPPQPQVASTTPKSGPLDLDDTDRWRLSNALRFQTINLRNGLPCEARLWTKPNDASAEGTTAEIKQIIEAGAWRLEGGRNAKTLFPDGITINAGQDSGPAFNCAYRLSELLESMKIKPVTFRANVTTPDLVDCKDCAEVIFGTTNKP